MKMSGRLALVVSFLGCISCASTQPAPFDSSPTIAIMTLDMVEESFGKSSVTNPYIAPTGLFSGKPSEFVVVRLDLPLERAARVEVEAGLFSPDGSVPKVYLMDARALLDFWMDFESQYAERTDERRRTAIYRSALPGESFLASAGDGRYYFVLSGPNPLPRPSEVHVEVRMEGRGSITFDEPLPPAEMK